MLSTSPETGVSQAVRGCILGTAVADAIGLPYEGLSPQRAERLLGISDRHRLLLRHGMVSDDTEHAIMAAAAMCSASGNQEQFTRDLARRLRWWFASLPAGVGLATLRSCTKLWLGANPRRSGVRSAGNGPAMRAPVLGVLSRDGDQLHELVSASTRITHVDPRANAGALAVAIEAHRAARGLPPDPDGLIATLAGLEQNGDASELMESLNAAARSVRAGVSTTEFARSSGLGKGVTGFVLHTVPVCMHACWTHPGDFRAGVQDVIACGGDADTTAAIVGGVLGARVGEHGIPRGWLDGLIDRRWVRSRLDELCMGTRPSAARASLVRIPRNVAFALIVIGHGLRRVLPPY